MMKVRRNYSQGRNWVKTVCAILRVFVVMAGVTLATQTLEVLFSTRFVYANESHRRASSKQGTTDQRSRYDLKIRETLNLQKDFGNPASAIQTLDNLFGTVKRKIKVNSQYNKEEAIRVLKAIGDVLKEEGNFEYRKNILLIEGLEKKKDGKRYIDCDDYSSIYLACAESLGLFLEPVYALRHVFLRCRLEDCEGFYWEPILASEKDSYFYREWLNIKENSSYPKVLDEKEYEAIQYCNLGVAWYIRGDYGKAVEYCERALELNPDFVEAFNNLGAAYAKQGKFASAIDCYKKAAHKNPNYATPFNNIGVAFYRLGDLKKAVKYFEKAIKADPEYQKAYEYKVAVLVKKGEHKKAFKFLKRIRKSK